MTVLDAGVLIAALDESDAHHGAAARALGAARDRSDALVVPASAYAEILVRPAVLGKAAIARLDAALDSLPAVVADATRDVARGAAALRARHTSLRLPDALVIATAVELEADHLLTTDRRWTSLRGLGPRGRLTVVG